MKTRRRWARAAVLGLALVGAGCVARQADLPPVTPAEQAVIDVRNSITGGEALLSLAYDVAGDLALAGTISAGEARELGDRFETIGQYLARADAALGLNKPQDARGWVQLAQRILHALVLDLRARGGQI